MAGISLDFKGNPVVVPGDGTGREVGAILDRDNNAYMNRLYLYNGTGTRTQISASGGGSFVTNLGVDNIQPAGAIPFGSGVAKDVESEGAFTYNKTTNTLNVENFVATGNTTTNNLLVTNNTTINNVTFGGGTVLGLSNLVQSAGPTAGNTVSLVANGVNAGKIKTLTLGANMTFADTPSGDLQIDSLAGGGGGIAAAAGAGAPPNPASLVLNATTVRNLSSPTNSVTRVVNGNNVELEANITSVGAGTSLMANGSQIKSLTSTGTSVAITNTGTTVNLEVNPSGVVQDTAGGQIPLTLNGQVKRIQGTNGISVTDFNSYVSISPTLSSFGSYPLWINGAATTLSSQGTGSVANNAGKKGEKLVTTVSNLAWGEVYFRYYVKGYNSLSDVHKIWLHTELTAGSAGTCSVRVVINPGAITLTSMFIDASPQFAFLPPAALNPTTEYTLDVQVEETAFPHSFTFWGMSICKDGV